MTKFAIGFAILYVIISAAVPALESWELPGSNVASASAVAAEQVAE